MRNVAFVVVVAADGAVVVGDDGDAIVVTDLCYLVNATDACDDFVVFEILLKFLVYGAVDICNRDALSYAALCLARET